MSTLDQNLDLQLKAPEEGRLREDLPRESVRHHPPPARIPADVLDQVRQGDTIIVWKLDRLARSTRDLLNTMETLSESGAKFQSISEPWANTTTHAGKMIMTVFAGIAEFERDLIRERTGAGREAAKKRGVQFGRPRKLNPEQLQLAAELIDQGKAAREIAKTFNVHEATIYRLAAARQG